MSLYFTIVKYIFFKARASPCDSLFCWQSDRRELMKQ
jgi:hypothetical protein